MTTDIDEKKRVRKKYPCPFCLSDHTWPSGKYFCEMNPDSAKRREKQSAQNRELYYRTGGYERLTSSCRTEIARIKRSNTAKKTWEQGKFGPRKTNAGHTQSEETKAKRVKSRAKTIQERAHIYIAKTMEKSLEKENLVTPVFGTAADFFGKKMDNQGWVEVENSEWNVFNNDYDDF